jgi:senataxin
LSLQYNELCDFILKPVLPKATEPEPKEVSKIMGAYKLNEPQAIAILKALKTDGFTLIQGLGTISFVYNKLS